MAQKALFHGWKSVRSPVNISRKHLGRFCHAVVATSLWLTVVRSSLGVDAKGFLSSEAKKGHAAWCLHNPLCINPGLRCLFCVDRVVQIWDSDHSGFLVFVLNKLFNSLIWHQWWQSSYLLLIRLSRTWILLSETGIFLKLRHYFSPSQLRQIYYNLIYPYLSYAVIAWGSGYKCIYL